MTERNMVTPSTRKTDLTTLIEKLQRNADKVEKNIFETEQNLNKDVVKINEGRAPLYQDSTNKTIEVSWSLLNELDDDAAKAKRLQHPQAEMIEHDMKQLRERVKKLRNDHNNVYHLTRSEGVPGVNWGKIIDEKMANLNNKGFGQDLPTIENEVDEHNIFHSEVEALAPYINQGEKDYVDGLQLKYNKLLASSTARQKHLLSLSDYMLRCTNELYWLDQQADERITYDWSDANLNYPARKSQYENFISKCLESKEGTITKLSDDGEKLIDQGHPGKNVIEAHMDALHADWKEYLNLLICEENHLKHMEEYHKFQTDVRDTQDMLKRLDTEIQQKHNLYFKGHYQLNDLLMEINDKVKMMDHLRDRMKAFQDRSLQVLPLKYRKSPPQKLLPIEALCNYDIEEGEIQRGERYTLVKNNGPKWDLKDSTGHSLAVPGVCFIIPPIDPDSVAMADNLVSLQKDIQQKLGRSRAALLSRLEDLEKDRTCRQGVVPPTRNEPEGALNTIIGEISGVHIQKKKKCSRCHHMQDHFDEQADAYKCEGCKMLQKSQSYDCILSGTIAVMSTGKEVMLVLTSPVIMRYLHANSLGDLMEHTDSLEKHFIESDRFQVSYDSEMVNSLTLIAQTGSNDS